MQSITNLAEIAGLFRPGMSFVVHSGCAVPPALCRQLTALAESSGPFHVFDLAPMGASGYLDGVRRGLLHLTTYVPGKHGRTLPAEAHVNVIAEALSTAAPAIAAGRIAMDVLLLHLPPPDRSGRFSLGVCCDVIPAALARNPIVVAEIDPCLPRTLGPLLDPASIDYVIEAEEGPLTVEPGEAALAGDAAIADGIASLVRDGDRVQIGVGGISDLVLDRLRHLSRFSIYSGLISDAVQPLVESGVISEPEGGGFPVVTAMSAGSKSFYRYLDRNPAFSLQPCGVTHDHATLGSMHNLCAINTGLEVDLAGNVNAERLGTRVVSGPGGMPDFAAGAAVSVGGRSIVAIRATSRDGATSRVRSDLVKAGAITLPGRVVDYIVTEHGVARLTGLSPGARAQAIRRVAAPEFRAGL